MLKEVSLLLAGALLAGCGRDGTVIKDTSPYFEATRELPEQNAQEFIQASEHFAGSQGLEISVNQFGGAQFSVLMYDQKPATLNLTALNTISHGHVTIAAYAKKEATADQRRLAEAYVAALDGLNITSKP